VPVYELGRFADDRPFFTMKLVKGQTLAELLKRRSTPADDLPHLLTIYEQMCQTVAYAHARGVVHRDLKPANLLRSATGQVKIADFGIARAVEETMVTQIGTVLGTIRYLAPEQAEGRVVGPSADVYSLGVVFDELLEGATAADLELIERMRAHDPGARPTATEVASALGATQVLPRPQVPRRRSRVATRTKLLIAGAAAAIVAASAIALAGSREPTPTRVEPVPHASTPAQQARNLSAWLERYSR